MQIVNNNATIGNKHTNSVGKPLLLKKNIAQIIWSTRMSKLQLYDGIQKIDRKSYTYREYTTLTEHKDHHFIT